VPLTWPTFRSLSIILRTGHTIRPPIKDTDGIINDEIMGNLDKINGYPIKIDTEESLIREVTRIGNLSVALGYKLEDEKRLLTKEGLSARKPQRFVI